MSITNRLPLYWVGYILNEVADKVQQALSEARVPFLFCPVAYFGDELSVYVNEADQERAWDALQNQDVMVRPF